MTQPRKPAISWNTAFGCSFLTVSSLFVLFLWSYHQGESLIEDARINDPSPRFTQEQRQAAELVMETVVASGVAIVETDGPHLVVNFLASGYPVGRVARLSLITQIANADAVLRNGAKKIYFYDPTGRLMGQADPLNGIRLKH